MSELLNIIFAIILLPLVIVVLIWIDKLFFLPKRIQEAKEKAEKLALFSKSQQNYHNSLEELKLNPTNADLKQLTLQFGRTYSEMTRQFQGIDGVTLFDEVKLMNDINVVCAGATSFSINSIVSNSVEKRLAKLFELKEKNLINEQEYEERRLKILDAI